MNKNTALTKEFKESVFKKIKIEMFDNEKHCVILMWRIANELERIIVKKMLNEVIDFKTEKISLVTDKIFSKYFREATLICINTIIEEINNHEPIATVENKNVFCKCKILN